MRAAPQNQNQQSASSKLARPATTTSRSNRDRHPGLDLQSVIGNQAVMRKLQPSAPKAIQTKLTINQPGDEFEQEADHFAEQVMRMPEPRLQRTCACGGGCPTCQTEKPGRGPESLQTKRIPAGDTGQGVAPPNVHEVLRSPGQSLDPEVRAFMEPRFGHDFSRVRVHSDAAADESAQSVNARAYTVGQNIVFRSGAFAPGTGEGRRLIAHELAHVVQQSGASPVGALQRQPDPKKEDKDKTQDKAKKEKDVPPPKAPQQQAPPQQAPPPKAGLPDYAVLLAPDPNFVTLATVIAPNATILHATSVDDLTAQLKTIKGPIGTLYFVAHMIDDGSLVFTAPGKDVFVLPETVAANIKGSVQVDSLDFRGCQAGQAPGELDKIRVAVSATKVTAGTCTLVHQTADPIKTAGGTLITQRDQLKDPKVKDEFEKGLKMVRKLFEDNKKKCIVNDTEDGYFLTGGKLIAVWVNPDSMAEPTAWDDKKSICFNQLKTEKIDPTKKLPVLDPDDCKLIEVKKP